MAAAAASSLTRINSTLCPNGNNTQRTVANGLVVNVVKPELRRRFVKISPLIKTGRVKLFFV